MRKQSESKNSRRSQAATSTSPHHSNREEQFHSSVDDSNNDDLEPHVSYPLPEDPPEYGEDGLTFLTTDKDKKEGQKKKNQKEIHLGDNGSKSKKHKHSMNNHSLQEELMGDVTVYNEYEDDEEYEDNGDNNAKGKKVISNLSKQREPIMENDGKSSHVPHGTVDYVNERIAKLNEEREKMVWSRRHPDNVILKIFQWIVPYGGIVSSAFSLASSTIGGGIIALPAAFHTSGMAQSSNFTSMSTPSVTPIEPYTFENTGNEESYKSTSNTREEEYLIQDEREVEQVGDISARKETDVVIDGQDNITGEHSRHHPRHRIAQMDAERAEWVAKRRQYTNQIQRAFALFIPYGGLLSSGFNSASSTIGAGIISLPSAFQTSGLIMALIYMVIIAWLTIYSLTLLGIANKRTGLRNYSEVTEVIMGKWAAYFLAFFLWFLSFGSEIAYVISIQDCLTAFLDDADHVPHYLQTTPGHRVLTAVIWIVFMLPLCLPKEINSLRYCSVFAIFIMIFFVVCMVVHSARNGLKNGPRSDLVYFQTGNTAIQGFSIFVFSFMAQPNFFQIHSEMYKPSISRVTKSAAVGTCTCFILYFFAGLFGYLDFGPAVTGSALKLYNPVKDPLMGVAYAGIMLKLCVGYGLHMYPIRDAVYYACNTNVRTIAWWKNAVTCGSFAFLSMIAGLFIPRVNLIFGLLGGLGCGFVSYIFPALLYMYSGNWSLKTVGWYNYLTTYLVLFVGVIGVVWGTAASIYGEVIADTK